MLQNVLGSDGQMHVENQVGNMRIDLTTGETKTVVPWAGGMNTVIGPDGTHTDFRPARCARLSVSPGSTGCSISTDKRSVKHRRS